MPTHYTRASLQFWEMGTQRGKYYIMVKMKIQQYWVACVAIVNEENLWETEKPNLGGCSNWNHHAAIRLELIHQCIWQLCFINRTHVRERERQIIYWKLGQTHWSGLDVKIVIGGVSRPAAAAPTWMASYGPLSAYPSFPSATAKLAIIKIQSHSYKQAAEK